MSLKLTRCETHIVAVPPPYIGGMYWIFVTLETTCGITGVGEVYAASFSPQVMAAAVEDVYQRYLHLQDAHQIERFYREAYSSGFTQRPDLSMMGVVSGLEMACWDIIGKSVDRPVYQLLGGKVRDKLRSYTYLYPRNKLGDYDYDHVEPAVEAAIAARELGFTALKFDPAGPYTAYCGHQLSLETMERSEGFCRRLREAIGTNCDLLFGTHGQMVPSAAIRLLRRLEPYDPLWFEEPVPPGNPQAMAEVARHSRVPIATGERLTTKYEFQQLLTQGAASILQMNLGRVGGILEAKKIAGMAETFYAQVAPHLYNGPIGAAASIQLALTLPNFLIQESIGTWDGFHAEILEQKIDWKDGYIIPSEKPGLGVALNMEAVRAHSPYRDKPLHLNMLKQEYDVKEQSDKRWRN